MSDDEMEKLRVKFRLRTINQAAQLKQTLARGDLGVPEIERHAHTIAGTGGTLGFTRLSKAAAVVDDKFAAGEAPTREQVEALILEMENLG